MQNVVRWKREVDPIDSTFAAVLLTCICIAIVLVGPGALSLDARLFGRREIVIPESPP